MTGSQQRRGAPGAIGMGAALLVTALLGCDRRATATAGPEPTVAVERGLDATAARMLAHVPARTPYVWAAVDPPSPRELARLQPLVDATLASVSAQLDEAVVREPDGQALIAALRGHVDRDGLVALGLRANPHWVLYGIGFAPVLRVELGDAEAIVATIDAIDAADGRSSRQVLAGHPTWTWTLDDAELGVAVDGDTLVLSLYPVPLRAEMLAHVAGATTPGESLARSRWYDEARRDHGLLGAGLGTVDLQRLVALRRGEGERLERAITSAWVDDVDPGDACTAGVVAWLRDAPRIWFGPRQLGGAQLEAAVIWQLAPALRDDLRGIVAPLPGLDRGDAGDALTTVAIGIDADAAVALAQRWIAAPQLRHCGIAQAQLVAPAWLRGLRGASLQLDEWDAGRRTGDGVLTVGAADPLRWLSDALPSLDRTLLARVGKAVRLDALDPSLTDPSLRAGWAARGREAVAAALGQGARHRARRAATAAQRNRGIAAVVAIDVHRWTERLTHAQLRAVLAASAPSERALLDATLGAIEQVRTELVIDDRGLELRSVTSLRRPITRR